MIKYFLYYIPVISIGMLVGSLQSCESANSQNPYPKTDAIALSTTVDTNIIRTDSNQREELDTIPPKIPKPAETSPEGLQRLIKAYPNFGLKATENELIWKDGTKMVYDDGKEKDFRNLLNSPDLEDQLASMEYPMGETEPPKRGEDPGRVRFEPFFFKMYGKTKEEVRENLVQVTWMPKTYGNKLWVTKINGVNKKIEAISKELDELKHLHKYLENPGGTFNWRKIAGTDRMSMHSFGMTIDINVSYSNYWRWAIKGGDDEGKKIIVFKNRIPWEIVKIFEKHGFIWGGKWYHYDTMHFEYRPELIR
ncbi:MAG: M15 family metallopeptidase [Saprospiraceae bacterium]|nr:M15 family metallopeptidase [Saprospiraceae bacterium]